MSMFRKNKWIRYIFSFVALSLIFTAYYIITVAGESRAPKIVLMRLEDIGPGGQYASMEQLGKLRAVLEYLRDQHVAYHMAFVPRWINLPPDGSRYDMRLDQSDNPYILAYQRVLHDAVENGASLGLHGYTHQVGNVRRDDGQHETGIGNEFNVPGADETMTVEFAEKRLKEGLAILQHAGLKPQFWESPHYRSTAEQDDMFRSYFGLNYQADVQTNRKAPAVQYANKRNSGYGASTVGAAYVPTPFDYIPYNKDEKLIVDRVGKSSNLPSFFYHPFLEFKHLVPVTDVAGKPVLRDGVPEYRYSEQGKSLLQKLIVDLRAKGYAFYTIHDYVPFTPSHSIRLQAAVDKKLLFGNVTGNGQTDLVMWDKKTGSISVVQGNFKGMRNEEQTEPAIWGSAAYMEGSAAAISGKDAEGLGSLWIVYPTGHLDRYVSDGHRVSLLRSWKVDPYGWANLFVLPQPNGDVVLAGLSKDRMQLSGLLVSKGVVKAMKPHKFKSEVKNEPQLHKRSAGGQAIFIAKEDAVSGIQLEPDPAGLQWNWQKLEFGIPNEHGRIMLGDFNGDGREDVLRWDPDTMRFTVYLQDDGGEYHLLSTFGPWGKPKDVAQLVIADFDGNGKSDLALVNPKDGYIDMALSFESK